MVAAYSISSIGFSISMIIVVRKSLIIIVFIYCFKSPYKRTAMPMFSHTQHNEGKKICFVVFSA